MGSWCLLGVEPDPKEPAGSPQGRSTSVAVVISFCGHPIGVCPCTRTARALRAGARSACSGVRGTRPRPRSQTLRREELGAQGEESELSGGVGGD